MLQKSAICSACPLQRLENLQVARPRVLQTRLTRKALICRTVSPEVSVANPDPSASLTGTVDEVQQVESSAAAAADVGNGVQQQVETEAVNEWLENVVDEKRGQAEDRRTSYNVVFVTSEAAPWSKTGGLGDVCGSLPRALAARGHRVLVVLPRYSNYPEAIDTGLRVKILGSEVGFFHHIRDGVDWVFVDHPSFPRPGGLYGDKFGVYGDNQFRFMLLSLAALEVPLQLQLNGSLYGQCCIFIANDWMASLVPVYVAYKYRPYGVYQDARCILAIHNLRHQGVFPPGTFDSLGLPPLAYGVLEWQYPPHQRQGAYEEEGRAVNTLKAGICTADRIVTVSPGYSWEVCTPEGGCGMESLLSSRSYVFDGVLNGIDMSVWNPETDQHIAHNYTVETFSEGKRACKLALQKEMGLPQNADIPMVGFIGRLDFQKGADLVLGVAPWLVSQGVQLVCLGTGDPGLETGMQEMESLFRDSARGWVGFNVPMSHKITAACDILLMPSRFEPCGLNQLYAMRYGTVPVAHATGGLKDTVIPFDPWNDVGTGWTFTPCSEDALRDALGLALHTLRQFPDSFKALQVKGMQRDSSWAKAAEQYEQIFDWTTFDCPYCRG